jgi:hypothetical protein
MQDRKVEEASAKRAGAAAGDVTFKAGNKLEDNKD